MIIAGDMGGTNTRLALVEKDAKGRLQIRDKETFASAEYSGLEDVFQEFLKKRHVTPSRACVGVAGPVKNGCCKAMNLPWKIDAKRLEKKTGIKPVFVINDLEANAYGIPCLGPDDVLTINAGAPNANGNGAVVSAGTGLGEAGMYWDGHTYHPFATEGGHTDFAPLDRLQYELYENLLAQYDHVSYERIVSGPGLVNIYRFLRDTGRGPEPAWLNKKLTLEKSDPAAEISKAAMSSRSLLCEHALDMFLELYGTEAGNMALKVMARGGVWLGGGIVVKVRKRLQSTGGFLKAFTAKGRLRKLMEDIPVRIILNEYTALLGAARYALDLA